MPNMKQTLSVSCDYMKPIIKIIFWLFFSALSSQTFSQSRSMSLQEIKAYRASIDSLYNLYDSLRQTLNDTAETLLKEII